MPDFIQLHLRHENIQFIGKMRAKPHLNAKSIFHFLIIWRVSEAKTVRIILSNLKWIILISFAF